MILPPHHPFSASPHNNGGTERKTSKDRMIEDGGKNNNNVNVKIMIIINEMEMVNILDRRQRN